MIDDEHSKLKKIQGELYVDGMKREEKRSILHEEKVPVETTWDRSLQKDDHFTPMQPKAKVPSFFKRFFFASLAFLAVAMIFFAVSFLSGGNGISERNVEIAVTTKAFVDGGETVPVVVTLINKNKLPLELATLVLSYPEGNDAQGPLNRINREIGTIDVGETHQESYMLQLYGAENSQKDITAHIEFRVKGSNAVYGKDGATQVTIRTSPVTLVLTTPDQAIPNQEIPMKFTITGNGTASLADTALVLEYPEGFTFSRAEPAPSFGNNVWYLGDLPPGVNRVVTVYGSISGSITDLKTIYASIGAQDSKNEQKLATIYNTVAQVIPLTNAFLDARFSVQNQTGQTIAISSNQQVQVRIPWKNTLSVPITNAQVSVSFSGTAYDPARVEPIGAFFDSVNNKLVWTAQQDSKLQSINPGETGQLSFSLRPKQNLGTTVNPTIQMSLSVSGYQSGSQLVGNGIDTKTITLNSDLNLLVQTLHYTGGIANTGPMPPTPNQETTYTLEFKIANSRNPIDNAQITTTLPTYVTYKGIALPQSESANVSYNEVTHQLIWNAGTIPSSNGSINTPKSLSIKVGITPSTQQLGGVPALTGGIVLTGHDSFTNQDLTISKLPLTTQLVNDGNGPGLDGKVKTQ